MGTTNTITGIVYKIGQTNQVSDKFSKREIAIKTNDNYPQTILIQFSNDKCALLDNLNVGDNVSINYNLRGRTWTGNDGIEKIFNTIDGWAITLASNNQSTPPQSIQPNQSFQQREQQAIHTKNDASAVQLDNDGLPF
jgi:hypothetical protein